MLLLVPVKEPNKANIDQIVNSLSDSIAKGDLEVTRVNSLVGKDGVPYLTQAHLDSLKKVSESVNRNIDTRMVEYDSGYTAGMVYVKYPSGVRGEIQIVGEKVLDIANAEHIPYDAFLGKPYAGAFPKENLGKASEILDPIRTAATSLDEVQKAKYLGYLNSQYTRARQIEQGASPAAVNLPEGISGKLSVDNLIKANGALNQLKATNRILPDDIYADTRGVYGYLPKPGSRYSDELYDFTSPEFVSRQREIRLDYLSGSDELENVISSMRGNGRSAEEIGTRVVMQRNSQKIWARELMTSAEVSRLEAGNIKRYGDPVGPTPAQLFKKYGDWNVVIKKSMEKDPSINILLGIEK
jgi:hypothetical protein